MSEIDEDLIEQVRRHEILYNTNLRDYHVSDARQSAWQEIADELGVKPFEAKKRWKILRSCLSNVKNRRLRDESKGAPAVKRFSVWKYERQMNFLAPFISETNKYSRFGKGRKYSFRPDNPSEEHVTDDETKFSATPTGRAQLQEVKQELEDNYEENNMEQDTEEDNMRAANNLQDLFNEMVGENEHVNCGNNTTQRHAKKEMHALRKDVAALKRRRKYEDMKRHEDERDLFFLSLAASMKALPIRVQTKIKQKLSRIVFAAELRYR